MDWYKLVIVKAFFLAFCIIVQGVEKSDSSLLSIEDVELGRISDLKPDKFENVFWVGDDTYVYTRRDSLRFEDVNGQVINSFSIESFNRLLNAAGFNKASRFPSFEVFGDALRFNLGGCYLDADARSLKLIRMFCLPSDAEEITFTEDGELVAYVLDNNLSYRHIDEIKKEIIISSAENDQIVFGKSVHRNEFGIQGGIFWSPSGEKMAYYKNDQSQVEDYPLVDIMEPIAKSNIIKYPMAGRKTEKVELVVYDLNKRRSAVLDTEDDQEHYLTSVSWSPQEDKIYVATLNRDQDHLKLKKFDAKTGKEESTIFEEKHDKYTEPLYPLYFISDNQFLWQTRKDGFYHLYLYDVDKGFVKQLTKGNWEVDEVLHVAPELNEVYFLGRKASPLENRLYSVNLVTGDVVDVLGLPGLHDASISPNGAYAIVGLENEETPYNTYLIDRIKNSSTLLLKSPNYLSEFKLGKNSTGTIKAADGQTELYYRMILPPYFDSLQNYPVIVYVYNGPHVQLVHNDWYGRTELWQQYMAQQGFISFTLDGRGSNNRGRDFENVTFERLGQIEMQDQLKGVEFLKSLPYVDEERMGVFGWSYGGFMALSLLVNHPEVFKTGVAGGPVTDWALYEVMYTERYMNTPQKNPAGYKMTSVIDKADKLDADLLIIHGAQDPVVLWQHSLQFLRAAIVAGKQVDYFVYPTHEHNVAGKDRVHLMEMVSNYFIEHL